MLGVHLPGNMLCSFVQENSYYYYDGLFSSTKFKKLYRGYILKVFCLLTNLRNIMSYEYFSYIHLLCLIIDYYEMH